MPRGTIGKTSFKKLFKDIGHLVRPNRMPKRSRKTFRRTPTSFRRKSFSRRIFRKKSGSLGDIHTFRGIVNGGVLSTIASSTSTHLGGQYIMKLSDLPIVGTGSGGTGLGTCFDFVRLNSCKMEFMPRSSQAEEDTQTGVTFLTALDEVPITTSSTSLTTAPTWASASDEDADITEATAYDSVIITPDYLRGMQNSKETEPYKSHTVRFIPTFYSYLVNNQPTSNLDPTPSNGIFEPQRKKWINLNYLSQNAGVEAQSLGPDFYGPMYCFSNNLNTTSSAYDVKLHYSVSFRRLKGR